MSLKLVLAIIISAPLMYVSFKLALQLFKLATTKRTREIIVGTEVGVLLFIEVAGINFQFTEIVSFIVGLTLWIVLLKKLLVANNTLVRAVGSFAFGYILAIIFAITAAVLLVQLFPV